MHVFVCFMFTFVNIYKLCTSEQVFDIFIFRLVFVPKELLNHLLSFAVVMNLIMYTEKESHNSMRTPGVLKSIQIQDLHALL